MDTDFILLSKQKKLYKEQLKKSVRNVPMTMIPPNSIVLNKSTVNLDNIPILKNLPLHELCEPIYFSTNAHITTTSIQSFNNITELTKANNFVAVMDSGFIFPFAKNGTYRQTYMQKAGPTTLITAAELNGKIIVAPRNFTKVTGVFGSYIFNIPLVNGLIPDTIAPTKIDMSAKMLADVDASLTTIYAEIIQDKARTKAYFIINSTAGGGKLMYIMNSNDSTFTKVSPVTPLNNAESVPVLTQRVTDSNTHSFLNIFDPVVGGFRIPLAKEPKIAIPIHTNIIRNPSDGRIFIFAKNNIGTIIMELVDIINGEEIINPVIYSNPQLVTRRIIKNKILIGLCCDSTANIMYVSITNENLTPTSYYVNRTVLAAINLNTMVMTKIAELPMIARSACLSADRSTLIFGMQRGCLMYKIDRKNFRLPMNHTLPGSVNVIVGLED